MAQFGPEKVTSLYLDVHTNTVWRLIAYCAGPSVVLENIADPQQRINAGVSGLLVKDMQYIREQDAKA